MQYFNLSENDSWKLHTLFSPIVVPTWLTKEQVVFCLNLHDQVYIDKTGQSDGQIVKIWMAIKSNDPVIDKQLRDSLICIYRQKMGISREQRQFIAFGIIKHFIEEEQIWQRDDYLKKLSGRTILEILAFGDTVLDMPDWQKREHWRRFVNEKK